MRTKKALLHFRAKDGRRGALHLSFGKDRLELFAEVEGSNRLKKIGESSQIGITLGPGYDADAVAHLFATLNL